MTRRKLKLEYIPNDSFRKSTFKKRRKGLMKKAHELSVLCGVDVCAIIYSPHNTEPDVWPPNPLSVQRVLTKYKEIPDAVQSKKKLNMESHLKQRLGKALEQYDKQRRDNKEKAEALMLHNILNGQSSPNVDIGDVYDLIWIIDRNLEDIHTRFQMLGLEEARASSSARPNGVRKLVEQPLLSKLEGNEHK